MQNLFKGFIKVGFDYSARVMELKESLRKIDECLNYGYEDSIIFCNKEMLIRFRDILLAPYTGLQAVNEDFMRKQSHVMKVSSLCLIGKVLVGNINKEKLGQIVHEEAKAGLEYVVDTFKENR